MEPLACPETYEATRASNTVRLFVEQACKRVGDPALTDAISTPVLNKDTRGCCCRSNVRNMSQPKLGGPCMQAPQARMC